MTFYSLQSYSIKPPLHRKVRTIFLPYYACARVHGPRCFPTIVNTLFWVWGTDTTTTFTRVCKDIRNWQQKGPIQMLQIVGHLFDNQITRDDTHLAILLPHSGAKLALRSQFCSFSCIHAENPSLKIKSNQLLQDISEKLQTWTIISMYCLV